MEKETIQKIKLGIFVTLGFIFLTLTLYLIGNQQNMFDARFRLSTRFSDVNGLKRGNNVRYGGIDVGVVERVTIVSDSMIEVDMLLREEVRSYLKKNAVATIGTDGLVGNVIVNIRNGSGPAQEVEDNDWIQSHENVGTDELLRTLSISNNNLSLLTQNLVAITDQINAGRGTMGVLLQDTMMAEQLQQVVSNLTTASEGTVATVDELKSTSRRINQGKGIIHFLSEDTVAVVQLKQTMHNLQIASERVVMVTRDLQQMIQLVEAGHGTAGLLISDTVLVEEVQQSVQDIQTGVELFNENMKALRQNFLLRRYFKKRSLEKE